MNIWYSHDLDSLIGRIFFLKFIMNMIGWEIYWLVKNLNRPIVERIMSRFVNFIYVENLIKWGKVMIEYFLNERWISL